MLWLIVALASYFLSALVVILDKFVLGAKKVSSPAVYAFYIGLLSLGSLIFLPFGFSIPSLEQAAVSLFSGFLFLLGILAFYSAVQKAEASRAAPLVGTSVPLFSYFLALVFSSEKLSGQEIMGAFFLLAGGLLISFDLPLKKGSRRFFSGFGYCLLAGFILALAYLIFKFVYDNQQFLSGFIWTRFGSALAALGLLLIPRWKKEIVQSLSNFKKPRKHFNIGLLVILNKVAGGSASLLFNYALSLGSVTLVNALSSSQYVFLLLLACVFSGWRPEVFQEKLTFWEWAQKVLAIVAIAVGIFLIARPASQAFF